MAIRRRWVVNILQQALPNHFKVDVTAPLTKGEFEVAELEAVRVAQQEYYGFEVLKAIQRVGFGKAVKKLKGETLKKLMAISSLIPYVDLNSLLRAGGRLQRSNLPVNTMRQDDTAKKAPCHQAHG